MLKTILKSKLYMVTQPDHAQVAGYLASHWGNEEFNAPGYFHDSDDSKRLQDEVILGVSEHDNGWWEWEATPDINYIDGLPLGLSDVLKNQQDGMDRWRIGIRRFSNNHPYASLIISFHAYWLYVQNFKEQKVSEFIHPLFWKGEMPELTFSDEKLKNAQNFVTEIEDLQTELIDKIKSSPECVSWLDEKHLNPHARFLQILDGLSLSLCSNLISPIEGEATGLGEDEFNLLEVPRTKWDDRVRINIKPIDERKIVCSPYPFDIDPLPVFMPATILDLPIEKSSQFQKYWHSKQKQIIKFEYCSAESHF